MAGLVLLKSDRDSVHEAVDMIIKHIDKRDGVRFEMGISEYSGQLAAAYKLLIKCKELLNKNEYALTDVTPGQFLVRMFMNVLEDDYWRDNIKSVYQITGWARKFATMTHAQFKKEGEARLINIRNTVNESDYAPVEGVGMWDLTPMIM